MRTRLRSFGFASLFTFISATGCAGPTASSDLAAIGRLANAPVELALAPSVDAQPDAEALRLLARPLDAEAAVKVALLNNRSLRAQLREVGVARGALRQAGLLPNPEVELETALPRNGHHAFELETVLEFDLTHALLTPLRAGVAEAALEGERQRVAGEVIRLAFDTRAAFYALQAAEQQQALANRALDGFAAGRDAARALLQAGNVAELDSVTQESAFESARAAAGQLELEVLRRRERLQRLLGLHGAATGWTIAGRLRAAPEQPDPTEDLEREAIRGSLELAQERTQLERLSRRARLVQTLGWTPDVSVGVRAEREEALWGLGAALRFTLPLTDRNQGEVESVSAAFDAGEERLHATGVEIRSAARELRNRLVIGHAIARRYEQTILPAKRRVLEQALLQYNAMQLGVFQLLDARRGLLEAELAYAEALREFWTADAARIALLAGQRVDAPAGSSSLTINAGASGSGGH